MAQEDEDEVRMGDLHGSSGSLGSQGENVASMESPRIKGTSRYEGGQQDEHRPPELEEGVEGGAKDSGQSLRATDSQIKVKNNARYGSQKEDDFADDDNFEGGPGNGPDSAARMEAARRIGATKKRQPKRGSDGKKYNDAHEPYNSSTL